ncbi:steroidogenic acute regulatory protein-like [Venturia canescens]|uniref:steroidogenic acute regulatory protein-like n=1 Tax=Venturia canescens TaxID=32260 RepID=UPI001C9D3A4E|nr:steroidogenic acute regulatory protein-like [Venturia canescens]
MMAEDHRQLRVGLAGETLLSASLQSHRSSYAQRSISSINRMSDEMPSEDLIAGARQGNKISNVRRFFCLFVTFDLFFTALVWLICTMIAGESIKSAFENQVVHYKLETSLFDIVMAAACRFTVLILFYAMLHLNHRLIIALTTASTCAFIIAKVSFFDWSQNSQPAFQGFLIITSFTLAWGEAWFFDFRVIPQETAARDWISANSMDPETAPLIRHLLDDPMGRVENAGNFFTPMDSPNHSDADDEPNEIGISAGSIEESSSDLPTMPRLTPRMRQEYKCKAEGLIDRCYVLLTSNEWTETKTTSRGDRISFMTWNHGKIMKIEGVIDAPASGLLDCLYENVEATHTWNKQVMESARTVIDEDTDIVYQSTKSHGGGIIGPRDFITLRHRGRHENYHIISGIGIHCNEIPARKNFTRGENGLVCWATESIEGDDSCPGRCRFTWILNTNLKGWIPRKVIDTSLTAVLVEFMGYLRLYVQELNGVTA